MDAKLIAEAKKLGVSLTHSFSRELDKYASANTWIADIEQFKKTYGVDDASIDVEEKHSYYDQVEIKIKITANVPKSESVLREEIENRKASNAKYLKEVEEAELAQLEKLLKKHKAKLKE